MLIVNQHAVPIAVDVVNAFAASGKEVTLFTGYVETGGKPLHPSVRLVSSVTYRRGSTFSRLFTWLAFSGHYFLYLLFIRRPGPVLVVTNPPLAPLITYWVSRIRSFEFYIQVYDLYPEALAQAGFIKPGSGLYKWWQSFNKRVFRAARLIFTLSASMREALQPYVPVSGIRVIHNWVDTTFIRPIPRQENPFLNTRQWHQKHIIMYSGNMGLTHDLESLIEAARILRNRSDLLFLFIGEGGKKQKLEGMVHQYALQHVHFLGYQTPDQFPFALAASDIGVVTLGTGGEGISVPSKTYSTMAAGSCLLVIAPQESELTRLVEHHEAGIAVEPGQPERLAAAIDTLFADTERLVKYQSAARAAALLFSPDNAFLYVREIFPA